MATDAVELYHRMPKELINEKTHVCVLNACSHSGFVNEARSIFQNIRVNNEWTHTAMVCQKHF
jgi:pentatricopeptide repeat protein